MYPSDLAVMANIGFPQTAQRIRESLAAKDSELLQQKAQIARLQSVLHANLLRAFPLLTQDELAAEIGRQIENA